jgi:N-acetylmuramoyl-L-alanine amidase
MRDANGLKEVRSALIEIGYGVAPEGASDAALETVLRAFQRHWHPDSISGSADTGTTMRLRRVRQLMCEA